MTGFKEKMATLDMARQELDVQRYELEQLVRIKEEFEQITAQITQLKGKEFALRKAAEDPKEKEANKHKLLAEVAGIKEKIIELDLIRTALEQKLSEAEKEEKNKRFDKYLAFANIRELLKNSDVKIGAIEKEAKCQPGYMSRLDKPGNSSEPSVEFLVTAAKMLNVSLDMLMLQDLTVLSATEKYILSFIEKLQKDTVAGKLEWNKESAEDLNNLEPETEGYIDHPLFDYYARKEEREDLSSRICMYSETFEADTSIHGDCYNLALKNGARLYLMNICKSVRVAGNVNFCAKEIWMYKPHEGSSCLITSRNKEYGDYVQILFEVVSSYMSRPRIKKSFKAVIDAFMVDDFEDDIEMPFN